MEFNIGNFKIKVEESTGRILSVRNYEREFLLKSSHSAVMTASLINNEGKVERIDTDSAKSVKAVSENGKITVEYIGVGGLDFDMSITLYQSTKDNMLHITASVDNRTDRITEWVDVGSIIVPRDLKYDGGDSVIYTSFTEGGLIDDISLREHFMGTRYYELGYDHKGIGGLYPNTCHMQFTAYYSQAGGVYFGAHDENGNIKHMEIRPTEDGGIRLEHQVMTGGSQGKWQMGYDVVIGGFAGDWYDAADIYRTWYENSKLVPVKIRDNKELPEWMEDSPVIIIYAIRGVKDSGDMTPNCYYPFEEGVKYVNDISDRLGCRVMALMMHWEGTAPWAPPLVWPPFGGEEGFKKAVNMLHEKGNLAGVYCSGIGWTTESYLEPSYDPSELYEKYDIKNSICCSPEGIVEYKSTLGGIRSALAMCAATKPSNDIVVHEVGKIAESGCDYCQYFDQNWGGLSNFCYSREHGHPASPGLWHVEAMQNIQKNAKARIKEVGSKMLLGTESAAAEPFMNTLQFNDLRYIKWFYYGAPVPAYAYVNHEYVNNFAGNYCGAAYSINIKDNPSCLPFTIAYAFAAGDMLSVVLGSNGRMHWAWCVDETVVGLPENQQELWQFVKTLNEWRRGHGKKLLRYGRMEKPEKLCGVGTYKLLRGDEVKGYAEFSELMYTKWSCDGDAAQFVVNFLDTNRTFSLERDFVLYETPSGEGRSVKAGETVTVSPYSVVMIK